MVTPIVSSKYRHLYQLCYVKVFSTNHDRNLLLLDYPGRVRSQITSVVCQIQRFDFDCNLVVSRKVIIVKVERRYGRKYGCDPAGRGAHLHANCSFSPPPALMAMKLPTIGNHI